MDPSAMIKKPKKSAVQNVRDKCDINTQTFVGNDPATNHSRHHLREAGKVMTPAAHEYVGSAVVHLYENPLDLSKTGMVVKTLCCFDKAISEIQAGLAVDELRRKTMAAFGRKPTGGQ